MESGNSKRKQKRDATQSLFDSQLYQIEGLGRSGGNDAALLKQNFQKFCAIFERLYAGGPGVSPADLIHVSVFWSEYDSRRTLVESCCYGVGKGPAISELDLAFNMATLILKREVVLYGLDPWLFDRVAELTLEVRRRGEKGIDVAGLSEADKGTYRKFQEDLVRFRSKLTASVKPSGFEQPVEWHDSWLDLVDLSPDSLLAKCDRTLGFISFQPVWNPLTEDPPDPDFADLVDTLAVAATERSLTSERREMRRYAREGSEPGGFIAAMESLEDQLKCEVLQRLREHGRGKPGRGRSTKTRSKRMVKKRRSESIVVDVPAVECYGEIGTCAGDRTCLTLFRRRKGKGEGRPPKICDPIPLKGQAARILLESVTEAMNITRQAHEDQDCEPEYDGGKLIVEWTQDSLARIIHKRDVYRSLKTTQKDSIRKAIERVRDLVWFKLDNSGLVTEPDENNVRRVCILLRLGTSGKP